MNTHYRLAVVARVAVIAGCMGMSSTLSARTDPQNVQTGADGARADHDEQAQSQGQMIRSAAQAPPVETRERVTVPGGSAQTVTIRVDNTGVGSWKYRNARNPPLVWNRNDPAPDQFRLVFLNATSGATVKVTLPAVAVPFIPIAGTDKALNPTSLLRLDVTAAQAEAQRLVNLSLTLTDQAALYAADERTAAGQPDPDIACIVDYLKNEARGNDRKLTTLIDDAARTSTTVSTAADRAALQALESYRDLTATTSRILARGQTPPVPSACSVTSAEGARLALNQYKAAHPGRAGARAAIVIASGIDALEQAAAAISEYIGLLAPPTVQAAAPGTPPTKQATPMERAENIFGAKLDSCESKAGEVTCIPTLTLAPNAHGWIEGRLLAKYPAKTVIKFRVTFPFALETEQPTDQYGYISLDQELSQSPNVATWTAAGSLSWVRDPYYGADGATIDTSYRYDDERTRQFRGTGRTALAYALGDRAAGTIELQFKNGILGRKDEDLAVKVNQYNFQVFGFTGSSLKFGKYLFAAPTDGLAINETGEGVTVRYRWLGVSHILKREGAAGAADPADHDNKVWLADVSNVAVRGWSSLRSLSFYALYGIDDTPDRERRYDTTGGEALFGVPSALLTGTIAYYRSHSRPHNGSPVRNAEGSAWLARVSKSWFDRSKPARTLVGTIAQGSGDDRNTGDKYEAYIGENAAYAPDGSMFLSGIVPRLRLEAPPFLIVDRDGKPVLDKNNNPTPEFTEKGLANRRFIGATFSDQTISPLEWLAIALQIPQKDVESRQSTFRLQYYTPTEQVLGTRTGSWEAQLEFLLESPKGVKYIIKYARVFAGGPLEPLFPREPFSFVAQCNISLK